MTPATSTSHHRSDDKRLVTSPVSRRTSSLVRCLRGVVSTAALLLSPNGFSRRLRDLAFWAKACQNKDSLRVLRTCYRDDYYLAQYPDVAISAVPGLLHYICAGFLEGRQPSPGFDPAFYLRRYADVSESGIQPLLHYALFGAREGRVPRGFATPAGRPAGEELAAVSAEKVRIENRWPSDLPLVSVVIPCFNYGALVHEAIESVLRQTLPHCEVIVVEGGSTDDSTRLQVQELESRYPSVRFFYRRSPHLVGDNRNYGILRARGRYICCLDADDLLRPTYLEVAVFLAERYGFDLVYPSVQCFGDSDFRWLLTDATFPEIAELNQVSTVALFRREAWEAVGGVRDWGTGDAYVYEDWEFWVRIVGYGFRA